MALPTPSQTVGPFFNIGLPGPGPSEVVADGDVRIEGVVYDGEGEPTVDALIEIWQADRSGSYSEEFRGFGRCETDGDGRFEFVTVKPGPVPGPGGKMQSPHINVSVFARGLLKRLCTRIYFPNDPVDGDPVLSGVDPDRRSTLVAREDGGVLRFDIHLQGENETVFFDV